ncbi:unnamed protein product [Dicrocoelium dendriticum]|nr:unnamed protein product [Dicrocoelium dendriticum]
MSRMPSSIPSAGPLTGVHVQSLHSNALISTQGNLPGSLPPGVSHTVHGMQLLGPHERDHIMNASGPLPGHYFPTMGMNSGSPHHVQNMLPHVHPHQFHHPHHLLTLGRIPHFIGQTELRIFEMNKRLQQRTDDCDSHWWEAFATDFFEDDATLTVGFLTEDGPKRYTIGRTLIPRYFRSIFESGCGELHYILRLNHEYIHHSSLTLDSEAATMTMNMIRSIPATVVVEGRLNLEFVPDELLRIRSWIFLIRSHREMIMRSMLGIQDPTFLEQLTKNITRYGMTTTTLNFFRLCVILEPMQELMSRQKAYSLTPRDCLKTTLFQKWQRMMPQETTRQPSKRRKRKGSSATSDGTNNSSTGRVSKRKQSPVLLPSHHIAQPGDVMIVGEPTLMGGDFGDEDERLITRLENTQYDAATNTAPPSSHMHLNFPGAVEPSGVISCPMGNMNVALNASSHSASGVPFRCSMVQGALNSHFGMCPGEPIYANSFQSMSQHPSSQQMSALHGHHPNTNRFMSHNLNPQAYTTMSSRTAMPASVTPNARDPYPTLGAADCAHHPIRSSSASSLVEGSANLSGFPTCPSPNMLSRPPARFTPPGMPNGLGPVSSVGSSQSSFLLPPEMVTCAGPLSHLPIPCATLCSPPPTSYTPEGLDSSNIMHATMAQAPPSATMKPSSSPLMFNCFGPSVNGPSLPADF